MSIRNTPIIFLSNQIYSGAGNVGQLSTNIGQQFSTQQSTITTSNLTVNRGIITLSNQVGDPTYGGQGLQLSNTGIKIYSDQLASLQVIGTGTVAEATFDTIATGGPLLAMGAGTAARGAFFFVNGDAININQTNQAVTIGAGGIGTAQSDFKLLVNGNAAFTSSMTLSNGDLSMSNVRTQKADLISTGINIYNGNFLQSNAILNPGSATFCNTNVTVNGALSTTGINYTDGALLANSYGSISTLALGAVALGPPGINAALDVNGTTRGRVQIIQANGSISSTGGNSIFFNMITPITVNLPSATSTLGGTLFYGHKNTGNTVTLSSIEGQTINGATTSYVSASGDKIVSILQIGAAWNITSL